MNKTKQLIIDAILLALLIISSKISIPVTTINFTLQVLVVLIIALIVPMKDSLLINFVYLVMGLGLQLPVFSTGGGIQYIYSPSFGFILGFIACSPVVKVVYNILRKRIKFDIVNTIVASLAGLLIMYIFGLGYGFFIYSVYRNDPKSLEQIIAIFIAPFVLIDICKVIVAAVVASRLNKILKLDCR